MIRLIIYFLIITIISVGVYAYCSSQRTFEAKFKNIDGLPKGAPVTALGVKIGEVVRTKPTKDGIIVTVKITNKSVSNPQAGSQLTITSFSPNQGRVLEIIPPNSEVNDTTAFIVQEPITTESWLHASLNLLEGLKSFSQFAVQYVTPENFEKLRSAFSEASESLRLTVNNLLQYEATLASVKQGFVRKSDEANKLLKRLQKPINSLNEIVNDKNLPRSLKNDLAGFSKNLNSISVNIADPNFINNINNFKVGILDHLNQVSASLIAEDQNIKDPELQQKLKTFNEHLVNLNTFYNSLNEKDVKKITKAGVKKARETVTRASEVTQN